MTNKRKILIAVILGLLILISVLLLPMATVLTNQDNYCSSTGSDGGSISGGITTGVNGTWTKSGTKANNVVKQVAKDWKGYGAGGGAIAGIIGNYGHESGGSFNPAVAGGVMPYDKATKDTAPRSQSVFESGGGGKGLPQFTPFRKFAELGDPKWESAEAQDAFVMKQIKQQGNHLPIGQRTSFSTFAKQDVKTATATWVRDYEQGSGAGTDALAARLAYANKAYSMLSLGNIKSDSSKLGNASDSSQESEDQGCPTDGDDDSSVTSAKGIDNPMLAKAVGYGLTKVHKGIHYSMAVRLGPNSYDCSGFVLTCLQKGGMKNALSAGNTVGMLQHSNAMGQHGSMFKQVKLSSAKKGTIIVTGGLGGNGGAGHTFFLMENYHGGGTKVLECSVAYNGIDNWNTYKYAARDGQAVALEPK